MSKCSDVALLHIQSADSVDCLFQVLAGGSKLSSLTFSAVPDLFFSNPAGAGFCWICNDKSGRICNDKSGRSKSRSRIFKFPVILLILVI